MKKRLSVAILGLSLSLGSAYAGQKVYDTGKLLSIESPEVSFAIPPVVANGPRINLPMHPYYQIEIQQEDIVYIGYCQTSDYKAEWRIGDEVQFRLQKDKMYLRRQNGKEFKLVLLSEAKLGPDGKQVTIPTEKKR